jgi:N-acetylmuramoyl-L-alanine amidase
LAELGPGALRGLVEDIVEANAEVLDTDNPSHVDSGTLPSAGGDVQQDSVADPEGKPKAIVGLFVGHNRGTGATAIDGADEWESRRKVANAAAEKLKDAGYRAHVIYRNGRLGYASAMREHGRATSSLRLDLALELHFNAFDGSAEGAEILVASQSTADTLGKAFVDATSAAYPDRVLRSGGVKLQTGGRGYLFNANQRCPSGVYEPCFGDSPEWEDYVNDVDKEAEYVADIVRRFNEEGS